jgi:hypothetical protein
MVGSPATLAKGRLADRELQGGPSTAVRNQVMRHNPSSNIFQAYLGRVNCDVQALFLQHPPALDLLKSFTHMSLTCDPRAPDEVPEEVLNASPPDPRIAELIKEKDALMDEILDLHGPGPINRAGGTTLGKNYN